MSTLGPEEGGFLDDVSNAVFDYAADAVDEVERVMLEAFPREEAAIRKACDSFWQQIEDRMNVQVSFCISQCDEGHAYTLLVPHAVGQMGAVLPQERLYRGRAH